MEKFRVIRVSSIVHKMLTVKKYHNSHKTLSDVLEDMLDVKRGDAQFDAFKEDVLQKEANEIADAILNETIEEETEDA